MNPWPFLCGVAVFAAGVLVGMLLTFLAAVIYALEDPSRAGRQRRTHAGMEDDR